MRTSHRNSQNQSAQRQPPQRAVRGNGQLTYTQRLAATLDDALSSYQVVTKVGMRQQDNLLYVTLEPAESLATGPAIDLATGPATSDFSAVPDPRSLLPILQSLLVSLKLSWLKLAKISARLPGQPAPLWQEELLFQKSAPIAQTLMNPSAEGIDATVGEASAWKETVEKETGDKEASAAAIGDVTVHIGGNLSGQMIIGNNNRQDSFNYTYHVAHGGVLNVAPKATVRSRLTPVMLRPRRFENLLDRRTVLPMLRESLWQGLPVEVYSAVGFGKTSLMRHVAHDEQLVSAFPDGVVYLSAHRQLAEDLLQSLYDAFYETSPPLKPSYGQVQQSLARKQSLVILNRLSLEKEEMDWLMAALPACTFVLVSVARFYWQEGAAIALKGLPLPESIALIQIELGRALSQDEQYAAKSLWAALSGNPLQLRRAAAQAKADDESLMVLVQSMQAAPGQTISARSLFQKMAGKLSARQQLALALMGAMGGVALSAEQSQAIAQTPEIAETLTELADLHLVEMATVEMAPTGASALTTYQLSADLTKLVPQSFSPQPWLSQATNYFIAEGGVRAAGAAVTDAATNTDAMLHLLQWTQHTGQWQESLALSRHLDRALSLNGQWAQWQQVLTDSVQAAEQLGDSAAKAWALHQLGTRSLALGATTRADSWLSRALRLREDFGDIAGAAVTRHNLAMIIVPLAGGNGATPLDPAARYLPGSSDGLLRGHGLLGAFRPWGAALLGTALLGGIGGLVYGLRPELMMPALGQVRLSDTDLDFGARALNSTSEPKGINLTNSGSEPIKIRQILLAGEGDFALVAASSASAQNCAVNVVLAPGDTCEVSTTFNPTTVGEHAGEIVAMIEPIAALSDVPNPEVAETQVTPVVLVGVGTPEAVPGVSFDTPGVNFLQTVLGRTSHKSVKITNDGSAPLEISQVEIVGLRSRAFEIETEDCEAAPLPPSESCSVVLTFTPTTANERTAQLSVTSNADGDNTLPLSGTGVVPAVTTPAGATPVPTSGPPGDRETQESGTQDREAQESETQAPEASPTELIAQDDSFTLPITTSSLLDVLANDRNPKTLEIIKVTQGQYGSVETDGRQLKYTPREASALLEGSTDDGLVNDSLTYDVRSSTGEEATVTVRIALDLNTSIPPTAAPPASVPQAVPTPANRDPVAIDYNFTIKQGEPLTINLLADVFDPDERDVLSLVGVANLDVGGQLENNGDGTVTYRHWEGVRSDQAGQYINSFEYTVTDGRGGEGRGVISITVIVPPPVVEPLPDEAEEPSVKEPSAEEPPAEEPSAELPTLDSQPADIR
ncbi:MAG: choice-of-anchor D domain-containing protein [Cyanobacteria bacterium J06598_3]